MDFVLIDGDMVLFEPTFGAAVVVVKPGKIKASSKDLYSGKKACIEGDEKGVEVKGVAYITPEYSIPGVGTLSIKKLSSDQLAKTKSSSGKRFLLEGSKFDAVFEVDSPAKYPVAVGGPIPDTTKAYSGKGSFKTSNKKDKLD